MKTRKPALRDRAARDALVIANRGLVWYIVRRQSWIHPDDVDDAVQVGYQAALRAAELWDARHGARFTSYAGRAILQWLRRWSTHNRLVNVPDHAVRKNTKLKPKYRRNVDRALAPVIDGFDFDLLPNADQPAFGPLDAEDVRRQLGRLPAADRELLDICVLEDRPLSVAAARFGVTRECVRQRKVLALERLRALFD